MYAAAITLVGIRSIEDVSDWEKATARYYESVYKKHHISAVVTIELSNQNTKEEGHDRQNTTKLPSVMVTYLQHMAYHSLDPYKTKSEFLQLPLSTEEYRGMYMDVLKSNLEGYDDLIEVLISRSHKTTVRGGNSAMNGAGSGGGFSMIIGTVCGITLFLLLISGFICYRRNTKNNNHPSRGDKHEATEAADNVLQNVATKSKTTGLGDMSVASGEDNLVEGENTLQPHCFDDAEELLTVFAPAGKLGIVIDSPDSGAPIIYSVKVVSPIFDKVQTGDRLVGVDDEDVRTMTALKVSRLISRKSSNLRKLTVIRCVISS